MRKRKAEPIGESPWRRADYAMQYFQISRYMLDRLADECNGKSKLDNKISLYHIPTIEDYILNKNQ